MPKTAANVIDQVEILLQDTANTRWTAAELLTYLNDAQRDIAIRTVALGISPAYTKTVPVRLKSGVLQTVPEDAIRLIDVKRNLGREWVTGTVYYVGDAVYVSKTITAFADGGDNKSTTVTSTGHGLSVGYTVHIKGTTSYNGTFTVLTVPSADTFTIQCTYVADDATGTFTADEQRYVCDTNHTAGTFATDLAASKWTASPLYGGSDIEEWNEYNLSELIPSWQFAEPSSDSRVIRWIPNMQNHKKWYCSPPQPNDSNLQYVEMTYSAIPKPQDSAAYLTLGDLYETAIQDYMLYRAYARDDDIAEGDTRSMVYLSSYEKNPIFGIK